MSMSDQCKLKIDAIHEVIILWRYLHSSYEANYLFVILRKFFYYPHYLLLKFYC